ncbi:MAG: pitrilysin family protein [Proteobacteria bacterium]|nr:pitrilysin family protein [Pseudomonadota bacterium]
MTEFLPRSLFRHVAVLALLLVLAPTAQARVFDPTHFTLENGLEVVVVSDHRAPVVTHMVWYRVGSADEPRGKSGIAHFLEHLMFKGTDTLGPGEASKIIAKIGGNENAFTSYDYTAYYQTVAPEKLATVMEIEADRMVNLKLDPKHVLSERDVILEERRTRTDNSDAAKFREQVNAAMYLAYPYRIPVIGWAHEMRQLSPEDAIAFYRRWYAPNNAIVVVAGDVTAETVRALAEKYYGPISKRPIAKRDRVEEPPQVAPRRLSMTSAQVGQAQISRRYLAPSHGHGETAQVNALDILTEILGGGTTSRLYRSLVVTQKIAVSAGSWYGGDDIGPSTFGFYASPVQGRTVEDVEAAIDAEINALLETGVTAPELADAIKRLTRSAIFARDSVTAPARIIGAALSSGRSIAEIESWPEKIAAVTAEDVIKAARATFKIDQSVTSILLPKVAK